MILIAHRGNINGPDAGSENHPDYIENALLKGFNVEVDVWFQDDVFLLGHDYPVHKISKSFLKNEKIWCHAKNFEALQQMLNDNIHCFWHEGDDYTLTSNGYIWTNTGKTLGENSILVDLNKKIPITNKNIKGICSDYLL